MDPQYMIDLQALQGPQAAATEFADPSCTRNCNSPTHPNPPTRTPDPICNPHTPEEDRRSSPYPMSRLGLWQSGAVCQRCRQGCVRQERRTRAGRSTPRSELCPR